jgi:hypothetical protein
MCVYGRFGLLPDYSIYDLLVRRLTTLQAIFSPSSRTVGQSVVHSNLSNGGGKLGKLCAGQAEGRCGSLVQNTTKSFTKLRTEDAVT